MQNRNPTTAKPTRKKEKEPTASAPPTSDPTVKPPAKKKRGTTVIEVEVYEGLLSGRRPTDELVLRRQDAAYRLRLLGKSSEEIAKELGISTRAAYSYVAKAKERHLEELKRLEGKAGVLRQFQVLNYIMDEMLSAWESSKRVKRTKTAGVETKDFSVVGNAKATETKKKSVQREEEEIGDASYLDRAMKASKEIRELLGLDAPEVKRLLVGDDLATKGLENYEDLRNLSSEELLDRYRTAAGISTQVG